MGALMIHTKESTSPSQSLITCLASGPAEDTFLSTPLALRNTVDHLIDGIGALLWAAVLVQPEYGMMIIVIRTIRQTSMMRSLRSCQRNMENTDMLVSNTTTGKCDFEPYTVHFTALGTVFKASNQWARPFHTKARPSETTTPDKSLKSSFHLSVKSNVMFALVSLCYAL